MFDLKKKYKCIEICCYNHLHIDSSSEGKERKDRSVQAVHRKLDSLCSQAELCLATVLEVS